MAWAAAIGAAAGSVFGGLLDRREARRSQAYQAELQREFAQQGIQWRVKDAQQAGVHPLYAIGAPAISASPIAVGTSQMGPALSQAGQNIGRAVEASMTRKERQANKALQRRVAMQQYQHNELVNENLAIEGALKMQDLRSKQSQVPPAMDDDVRVENVPVQRVAPPELVEGQGVRVPTPWGGVPTTGNRMSQQTLEDMYGGIVGELYGVGWALHDAQEAARDMIAEWLNEKGIRISRWEPPRPKRKPRRVNPYSQYE